LGNSCYFNAVLQALASCSSFVTYIDSIVRSNNHGSIELCEALLQTLHKLQPQWARNKPKTHAPCEVDDCLRKRNYRFELGVQQDAEELFQLLLDLVDEEAQLIGQSAKGQSAPLFSGESPRHQPRLSHPLTGTLFELLHCSHCNGVRMKEVLFIDITLAPLPIQVSATHIHTYTHTHIHPHTPTYIYTPTHRYLLHSTYIHIHPPTVSTYSTSMVRYTLHSTLYTLHTYTYTHIHIHPYTHIHIYTHPQVSATLYTYIHTHTYSQHLLHVDGLLNFPYPECL